MAKYLDFTGLSTFWANVKEWIKSNLKTVNGESLIGSGDITISSESGDSSDTDTDPVYMVVLVDGVSTNYIELAYGESVNIECRLMRGWNEYSGTPDTWSIVRDSGDEADDAAWLLRDKVQSFAGSITLCYGADESDLPSDTSNLSATFTITASEGGTSVAAVEIAI